MVDSIEDKSAGKPEGSLTEAELGDLLELYFY